MNAVPFPCYSICSIKNVKHNSQTHNLTATTHNVTPIVLIVCFDSPPRTGRSLVLFVTEFDLWPARSLIVWTSGIMSPVHRIDTRAFVSNGYILAAEDSNQEENDNTD